MATKVSSTNSIFRNKLIPMVAALAALGLQRGHPLSRSTCC